MKPARQYGVFHDKGVLWTKNRVPGKAVYGEKLRTFRGDEYRLWVPGRSKMAALARKDHNTAWPDGQKDILYLGASTGTTVSHLSDCLADGSRLVAIEFSPRSVRDLLWNVEARPNVIPVLEDAGRPERYAAYLDRPVGTLVQDVAQRHQVEIFLRNIPFLEKGGLGFLFVKARSIDVARSLDAIYAEVAERLKAAGLQILSQVDLEPFERDHRAFVVRK